MDTSGNSKDLTEIDGMDICLSKIPITVERPETISRPEDPQNDIQT